MRKDFFAKDGDVAARVFVVFVGVERAALDANQMVATADFAGVDLVGGAVVGHFLQHVRWHVLVRQILSQNNFRNE